MALSKSVPLPIGITAERGYCKIVRVALDAYVGRPACAHIEVSTYASAEARQGGFEPAAQEVYSCPAVDPAYAEYFSDVALLASGLKATAYNYLKTLPEFAGAEDC